MEFWAGVSVEQETDEEMECRICFAGPVSREVLEETEDIDSRFIWGPFSTKEEAEQKAREIEECGFEGEC